MLEFRASGPLNHTKFQQPGLNEGRPADGARDAVQSGVFNALILFLRQGYVGCPALTKPKPSETLNPKP